MPRFEGQFISVVFIGRHNPQILNHDFLLQHNVIPREQEPFKTLFAKQPSRPFSEFVSTPVVTSIKYGPITILVDENRYQIRDEAFTLDSTSPALEITRAYFGDLLVHTPLFIGGMNVSGKLIFGEKDDVNAFTDRLVKRETISEMCGSTASFVGVDVSFPWREGMMEMKLSSAKDAGAPRDLNFNYEFKFRDMPTFLANLRIWPDFGEKVKTILSHLDIVQ